MSDVWTQLDTIDHPIGDGGRSWYPFDVRSEVRDAVAALPDPVAAISAQLAQESRPEWVLMLLVLLAHQDDPEVDDLLVSALGTPALRPASIYLLGAIGTRGWPRRERNVEALLAALRPWLGDEQTYADPVHGEVLRVGDLALAAYVRIAGPQRFDRLAALDPDRPITAELIGMELARFTPTQRTALLADVDRLRC